LHNALPLKADARHPARGSALAARRLLAFRRHSL